MAAPKGNQYGRGHHVGRPLKFENVEELKKKIERYFADCDPHVESGVRLTPVMVRRYRGEETLLKPKKSERPDEWRMLPYMHITEQKPYTITGLAIWLNTTRELLISYERREAFSDTIKRAKSIIHAFWEAALFDSNVNPAGVIFNLKNNWGWKDSAKIT